LPAAELAAALLTGLDELATGVALLDEQGRLLYANATARAAFVGAGWSVTPCTLDPRAPREHADWCDALRLACVAQRRLLFPLRSAPRPCFVALMPVSVGPRTLAMVSVGRQQLCGPLELQLFASHHQLSAAENRVLNKLAEGLKPAEIAAVHGVAPSTVSTQVVAIREKTHTCSVRQLLALLSRLPTLRPLCG
jgi:DNA-binding CsgD family transcriptional regulator